MGKDILQPEIDKNKYITSFLFKLRDKPAALYSALSGFAINGVNMTKLQSFPEKNSFSSFFFLCDIDGHLDQEKIKNSLEELAFHCEDMHVLGVYKAHSFREKIIIFYCRLEKIIVIIHLEAFRWDYHELP